MLLVLARHRRIAAVGIGTVLMLYILPLAIYGPAVYFEWFKAFNADKHWLHPLNIAFMPLVARYTHPHLGAAIAVLLALYIGWWAVMKKPDFNTTSGAGLCLGILCAPLGWFQYILFVAPFFMTRKWTALAKIGAGMFLIVTLYLPASILGILYLVATVLILSFFVVPTAASPPAVHVADVRINEV